MSASRNHAIDLRRAADHEPLQARPAGLPSEPMAQPKPFEAPGHAASRNGSAMSACNLKAHGHGSEIAPLHGSPRSVGAIERISLCCRGLRPCLSSPTRTA
jgi:hypothetical protein